MISILIIFFTLIALAIIHEFGHFIIAKKFGVPVEEFGIGYPPRIFGKKMGQTLYSLNLLPFGAFVKIYGEKEGLEDSNSFQRKSVEQRALITLGGVLSFWIVGIILLSIIFAIGAPVAISDTVEAEDARIQVVSVASGSPAEAAGIKMGDTIKEFSIFNLQFSITKIKQIQELTEQYSGEKINLTIERGKESFKVDIIPRVEAPEGEGAMGVALVRTIIRAYPLYLVPLKGINACIDLTSQIVYNLSGIFGNLFQGKGLPPGVELVGPIGVGSLMNEAIQTGPIYYLQFVAIIAIHLAVFNILPIPALDGGKLLFLGIEKIKGSPINIKLEEKVSTLFFILLIIMIFFVSIKDIINIF